MPTTQSADVHPTVAHLGSSLRTLPLLAAVEDETDAIVAATAAQIRDVVVRAQRDLELLAQQVGVAVSGVDGTVAEMPRVSPAVHDELVGALFELDRFIERLNGVEPSRALRSPARRLGRRSMALLTAVILTCGASWIMAARWMMEGSDGAVAGPDVTTATGTSGASRDQSSPRDALRLSAERWLHTYFDHGSALSASDGPGPTIQDERPAAERAESSVRRTIAPARVELSGEAAVLSTSVTEYPAGAGPQTVALVSQLWTRAAGEWRLDQVRIVSAQSAERAFRQE